MEPTGHVPKSLEGTGDNSVRQGEINALYSLEFGPCWWRDDAFCECIVIALHKDDLKRSRDGPWIALMSLKQSIV